MTVDVKGGLAILRKYKPVGNRTVVLEDRGDYMASNVLCEDVSYEDQCKLIELGWTGADDWMGYKKRHNRLKKPS